MFVELAMASRITIMLHDENKELDVNQASSIHTKGFTGKPTT